MVNLQYLHTTSWAGLFATPVEVLSRGKKFAKVRLRHQAVIGRRRYPAGTVKTRVPLHALLDEPSGGAYVSIGRGNHVPKQQWVKS